LLRGAGRIWVTIIEIFRAAEEHSMKWKLFVVVLASAGILVAQQASAPAPVPVESEPLHKVVFKNDVVTVMHLILPPGERTQYHTHTHDRIAVTLSATSTTNQKWNEAEGSAAPTKPGDIGALTLAEASYTHRVHNVGSVAFDVLDIEPAQRPATPSPDVAGPVAAETPKKQNGIYTSTKLIRDNPDFVRRYMRAYVEAIHYYKTHKEDTMKIMRKYSRVEDRKILEEAWDWHTKFMPEAPYPPADGYQLVLQDMAEKNPKAAQANVKDYIDTRFVKELEDSGFIKNLSRK